MQATLDVVLEMQNATQIYTWQLSGVRSISMLIKYAYKNRVVTLA
jgi:hypothetical protein